MARRTSQRSIGFRLSPNAEGALWMLSSTATFSLMACIVKFTGEHYPPAVQGFYRHAAGLILMIPVILRLRGEAYRTTRPLLMTFRVVANTISILLTFYAFAEMPLAAANGLVFTRALWLAPMAMIFLGEKAGPLRIAAVLIGFAGVVVMLGPTAILGLKLDLPALAVLTAAFLQALVVLGVKATTKDTSPIVLMVWSMTFGTLLLTPFAVREWVWPDPLSLALLSATGAIALVTQITFLKAMQVGDASAMAPMDYFRLIFSAILGFIFFHEVPTLWTFIGGVVVAGSTLFVTLREQQLAERGRRRALDPEADS